MDSNILICVPTCGGPYLVNCINSLAQSENTDFDVVIVFNGKSDLYNAYTPPASSPFNIEVCSIKEQGVVHVRNFFIDYAFRQHNYKNLIMLDDDQQVAPDWFANISAICASNLYEIVGSYVKPIFLGAKQEPWMGNLNVYYLNSRETGVVDLIHGTGGTMFSNSIVDIMGDHMFDIQFAASGGEDADFFIRAKKNGARFYRAREAVCFETIDKSRSDFAWAKKRYYRIGFCDAKLNKKFKLSHIFSITAFLSIVPYLIMSTFHPNEIERKRFLCLFHRQIGKLSFLLKKDENFYKKGGD